MVSTGTLVIYFICIFIVANVIKVILNFYGVSTDTLSYYLIFYVFLFTVYLIAKRD